MFDVFDVLVVMCFKGNVLKVVLNGVGVIVVGGVVGVYGVGCEGVVVFFVWLGWIDLCKCIVVYVNELFKLEIG